jgi:hypothetical protein
VSSRDKVAYGLRCFLRTLACPQNPGGTTRKRLNDACSECLRLNEFIR